MAAGAWRIVSAMFLLSCEVLAGDRIITDPEVDYVSGQFLPEDSQPSSEVYRRDFILGKGQPATVFLSYKGMADRSGQIWAAYHPVAGGYQRIDYTSDGKLIQFRNDFVFAGEYPGLINQGGLLVLYPGKGGGDLVRYEIKNGVAKAEMIRVLDYDNPEDASLFEGVFHRKVGAVLDPSYFTHPPFSVISAAAIRSRTGTHQALPVVSQERPKTLPRR